MRQQHRQAALAAPLSFTGADELVNHDLSAVSKIAELSFPNRQTLRRRAGVAVFKCQNRLFRQGGVNYCELSLMLTQMLQRNPNAGIPAVTVLVMPNRMTMTEGSAAGVFTGNSNGVSARQQCGKSQMLGQPPIHTDFFLHHQTTVGNDLLKERMEFEVFRNGRNDVGKTLQFVQRNRGLDIVCPASVVAGPINGVRILALNQSRLSGRNAAFETAAIGGNHFLGFFGAYNALECQLVGINLTSTRMNIDLLVHQRLRQSRSVLFVVA